MDRMSDRGSALSAREIEVLQLVADGLSNDGISKTLHLSQATVKSHLVHVYAKLNVDSRTTRGLDPPLTRRPTRDRPARGDACASPQIDGMGLSWSGR